jgi:hypothetical protein
MTIVVKRRKEFIFLSLLIGLSLVPQIIHEPYGAGNFTPHITLLIPFLILLISFGISKSLELIKNRKYKFVFLACLVFVYIFLFAAFLNTYFFRFPLQEGTFEMQNRTLSKYISLAKSDQQVTAYVSNPALVFKEFLFYSDSYNNGNAEALNSAMREGKFSVKNVSFLSCDKSSIIPKKSLVIDDVMCGRKQDGALNIVQLSDSGARYYIYNDKLCSKYELPQYVSNLKLADFNIEKLSTQEFCQTFIVSY